MVMKVCNIQKLCFKGVTSAANEAGKPDKKTQINELSAVTPDFQVQIPQKYTELGITELPNGLKLHQYKLANGHKVTIIPMEGSPAVVKNYVNAGSMNETPDIKGISHFLEHMAFNGTNGENGHLQLDAGDSFKKIDEIGGWANASTNYAITDYVNSAPLLNSTDLEQQIKIIAAMTEDLKLSQSMIEKEKKPVCSEINMILDDPQTIALDQTVRTLYNIKNPADELVGGSVKHIQNLTREDVVNYYNKYYTPDNMNLVITGDINPDDAIKIAAKNFNSKKVSQGKKFEEKLTPIQKTLRKDFINSKTLSTDIIIGFAGPKNNAVKDRVIYDLAKAYLLSYSVNLKQNLKQLNSYPYIESEKISTNPNNPRMIYLAANVSEENSEKALRTMFSCISNAKKPDETTLNELKARILKSRENTFEYSSNVNDIIGKAVLNNNLEYVTKYNDILKSITPEEVFDGVKKYFDLNKAAITVIHPQNEISFKGGRKPINTESISEYKLKNGFAAGLHQTKNSNISYNISLYTDKPYNKKAGVIEVLDLMYSMGNCDMDEAEMNRFKEKNNITLSVSVSNTGFSVFSESSFENRNIIFENSKKMLYSPRFTEENLAKAKAKIKDFLTRRQETAYNLYINNDAKNNPYEFSDQEILESLEKITLDDVKDCHSYLIKNSRGIITANIPQEKPDTKNEILKNANMLKQVLPNQVKTLKIYKENPNTKVLTSVNNNSQADIMQVFKFKCESTTKECVLAELTNSLLTSSSIGLFNTLREKEHLAYSVYSDIKRNGDCGEISCNILTTTDNKEIGEFSYDNVQKSINGFNRQIGELKAGKFTDQDLDNAKRMFKSSLLNNEGVDAKLNNLNTGLNSQHGITYLNKLYREIDKITKQDIIEFAVKAFKNPPIYSITASQDTIDYNKEYFESLLLKA